MKPSIVGAATVLLLALCAALSGQQRSENGCDFNLSGAQVAPNITGPDEIVAITHVVDQPDSPIKIVAADFKNSFITVSNERFTEQLNCTLRVQNQSDRAVRSFETISGLAGGNAAVPVLGGYGASPDNMSTGRSLMPGEQLKIHGCGGRGDGGAPNNRVRLFVSIGSVLFDGCVYVPSRRFPTLRTTDAAL
jgi:hypothetical protein